MDLDESGINRKAFIKGNVAEIFGRIRPQPILTEPLKDTVQSCIGVANCKTNCHGAETIDCANAN
jgi:hypothetical protein